MKYTYICFMKSSGKESSPEEEKMWFEGHEKVCKAHNVKLHTLGIVYGVVEEYVGVYETDYVLDDWQKFRNEVTAVKPQWIAYTRTHQVLNTK